MVSELGNNCKFCPIWLLFQISQGRQDKNEKMQTLSLSQKFAIKVSTVNTPSVFSHKIVFCSDFGSKWQCRKVLNSHSPIDTLKLQLYTEQFPLEKNLKTGWATTSQQANERWTSKAKTESHHKPHPQHGNPHLGENSKPTAIPWVLKGLYTTSGMPTFKTNTWEKPKTSGFEDQWGSCPQDPQGFGKLRNGS